MEKEIDIDDIWFDKIAQELKIIEEKKNSPKWSHFRIQDKIVFVSKKGKIHAEIIKINYYTGKNCLETYLRTETLKRTLPGVKTIKEGIHIYKSKPINWTDKELEEYGIQAIKFKLI